MPESPFRASSFLLLVSLLGLVLLLGLVPHLRFDDLPGVLFFGALAIVFEWILIPLRNGALTIGFSAVLPTFILHGVANAAWVSALGSLVGNGLLHRRAARVAVFNASQYVISTVVAGLAYGWAAGAPGGRRIDAPAVALFVAVYLLVNHSLVQGLFSLRRPGRLSLDALLASAREPLRWEMLNYTLTVPLGLTLVWLYMEKGILATLLLSVPLVGVAHVLRLHLKLDLATRELTILYQVAQRVGSALELEKVFELVADAVHEVTDNHTCVLFLYDEIKGELTPATVRHPDPARFRSVSIRPGEGIVGAVAQKRVAELLSAKSPPLWDRLYEDEPTRWKSLMVVPLVVEDHLIGVIAVGHRRPDAFNSDHLRMLTILSSQAAVAIQNAILYKRTKELAVTDPVTGLYNYRYFYIRLGEELKKARLHGSPLSLIYMDVDNFKHINDTYGHQAGDAILSQFAEIIRASVRESDTPARYAGDEFVILLPDTDLEEAINVAERVREAVARETFAARGGVAPGSRLTVSTGVASYPATARSEAELIFQADQAMYRGKREGLNRVYTFEARDAG